MNSAIALVLAEGVVIEPLGEEVLVLVPNTSECLRLSGDLAKIIRGIQLGVPAEDPRRIEQLTKSGILKNPRESSRRRVIKAGVLGAGVGLVTLALPTVAMASSGVDYILLEGFHMAISGGRRFYVLYEPPENEFPTPVPDAVPMSLNVEGLGEFLLEANNSDEEVADIQWSKPGVTDVSGNYQGTFSWGPHQYLVTFVPDPNSA